MMIPSDKVSFVIGTKGAVIHDIQRNSGAIVQVERGDSKDPNSLLRGVNISGSAEQIEAAKAEINRVIGTTAGVHEFRDDEFAKEPQNPYMSGPGGMGSLFNTALDLESMQKYMEMQMMSQQGMIPTMACTQALLNSRQRVLRCRLLLLIPSRSHPFPVKKKKHLLVLIHVFVTNRSLFLHRHFLTIQILSDTEEVNSGE